MLETLPSTPVLRRRLGYAALLSIFLLAPGLAHASVETTSGYASGWSVNHIADWTPYPPNTNPLGAANDYCTGASTPSGSWAEFTFGNLGVPSADKILGIVVSFKYTSAGTNTARLYLDGSAIGSNRSVGSYTAPYCSGTDWQDAGGTTDLWGTSLEAADFNSGDLSVRLTQDANTIDLDAVEITVYHESRHFASGWSVNNIADWTPYPPSTNPLGAPNDYCTGASTPTGSWAELTFPDFTIPSGDTITGVEVRFKLNSAGTNTAQLYDSGSSIGSTRSIAALSGSYCSTTDWVDTGGVYDTWGVFTLSPADFNNGDISVRLTQDFNTVDLDSVEMIVHH